MLRKEICYLKLTLSIIQLIVIFICFTQVPVIGLVFNTFTYNTLAVVLLFALNGYAYHECLKNRFLKGGHLATFVTLIFQTVVIFYLISAIWLLVETYVLWKNQVPRPIEKVFKLKDNFR